MTGYREIPLTRGYVTLVDARDYEEVSQFKWQVIFGSRGSGPYAARGYRSNGHKRRELMHRRLVRDAIEVDHINGDGLDNRRSNLRPATKVQNGRNRSGLDTRNTSGYRGVTWNKHGRKWHAQIQVNGRTRYLGCFTMAAEAARVFDAAAIEHFGEFAGYLNFPPGEEEA